MIKTLFLLLLYSFISMFVGKFLADTPSGTNYIFYAFWLVFIATIGIVVYLLMHKINLLEKDIKSLREDVNNINNSVDSSSQPE